MILGKEALRRGHDCDGASQRFSELDRLFFRARRPQLAADQQNRLLFALQELRGGCNGSTQRLRVARLLAKDRTDRAPPSTRSRCNVACNFDIGRLLLTQRTAAPSKAFNEAWLVCGRRAGKSSILALTAVFLACFKDYKPHLAPGEVATIRVMAADRAQARTGFRYVGALLREKPLLQKLITRETADTFELSNRVAIEIGTASFRSTRGYTFAAVLADEIAFWYDENSANPDEEVLVALRPGLITIPGAMLLCASSPYARKGALWQ